MSRNFYYLAVQDAMHGAFVGPSFPKHENLTPFFPFIMVSYADGQPTPQPSSTPIHRTEMAKVNSSPIEEISQVVTLERVKEIIEKFLMSVSQFQEQFLSRQALRETAYLLRTPANAKRLTPATAQLNAGKGVKRKLAK